MFVEIDFNSEEAIYIQLRNQIVIGIAAEEIQEGESLPSVRELADNIGINMHTVNKAYSILKQEGYLQLDRRKGAIIAIDPEKYDAKLAMMEDMRVILAEGICKDITCEEVHQIIDLIFGEFKKGSPIDNHNGGKINV
ncbi:MAG: GntR family transcriptional regulator [Acetivibrio sp.]